MADNTISLREIVRARNRRRRELRETIKEHSALIQTCLDVHDEPPPVPEPQEDPARPLPPQKKLKRYYNE